MTTVKKSIEDELKGKINNIVPLDLYVRQSWLKEEK